VNIDTAFPSNYLKSSDFDNDTTYTISRVEIETLGQGRDAEQKAVLYFDNVEKGLVLNKTNSNTIKDLYGPETDDWTGQRITLFPCDVEFGGKMTPAIRIRPRKPAAAQQRQQPQRPAPGQTAQRQPQRRQEPPPDSQYDDGGIPEDIQHEMER
jgi:hypothetical protein